MLSHQEHVFTDLKTWTQLIKFSSSDVPEFSNNEQFNSNTLKSYPLKYVYSSCGQKVPTFWNSKKEKIRFYLVSQRIKQRSAKQFGPYHTN